MPHRSYTWQATDLKFIVRKAPTKLAIQTKFQLDWSSYFWDILPQTLGQSYDALSLEQSLKIWVFGA